MKIWSDAIEESDEDTGIYTDYSASRATALYSGGEPVTTVQGAEYTGDLYVVDPNDEISVIRQPSSPYLTSYFVYSEQGVANLRGSQYGETVYTRYNGATRYKTSAVTVDLRGAKYPNALYYKSGDSYVGPISVSLYYSAGSETYYTRSGGVYCYQTEKVDTALYEAGGTLYYNRYSKVEKDLYEAGSRVTYPAYKAYDGETLYKAGSSYSGGLYTDYRASSAKRAHIKPAEVTTQTITALTV